MSRSGGRARHRRRRKSKFYGDTDRAIHEELLRIGFEWADVLHLDLWSGGARVARLYKKDVPLIQHD